MSPAHTAIVTGSSSGIGAAVALRLLADGWCVWGLDIAPPLPACLEHARFVAHALDLCDATEVLDWLRVNVEGEGAAAGGPQVHAWVHAAGVMGAAPLGQLDARVGDRLWRLHVQAATLLANALLPRMAAARQGRAVMVGSRVWHGKAGRSQYAASKAALVSLARSWAAEVVTQGVTVNVVSPAATDTPMLVDPKRSNSAVQLPPIGRLIQATEVAALVVYVLGDAAAAITGQDIAICGGASLPV